MDTKTLKRVVGCGYDNTPLPLFFSYARFQLIKLFFSAPEFLLVDDGAQTELNIFFQLFFKILNYAELLGFLLKPCHLFMRISTMMIYKHFNIFFFQDWKTSACEKDSTSFSTLVSPLPPSAPKTSSSFKNGQTILEETHLAGHPHFHPHQSADGPPEHHLPEAHLRCNAAHICAGFLIRPRVEILPVD